MTTTQPVFVPLTSTVPVFEWGAKIPLGQFDWECSIIFGMCDGCPPEPTITLTSISAN